jgi:hypothetical protein
MVYMGSRGGRDRPSHKAFVGARRRKAVVGDKAASRATAAPPFPSSLLLLLLHLTPPPPPSRLTSLRAGSEHGASDATKRVRGHLHE